MKRLSHFGVRSRREVFQRGATVAELMVAATLLVSALATVVPLAVRVGRVQRDARHYQFALEELSNQLDRLSGLDEDERGEALSSLVPTPETSELLAEATLHGEQVRDRDGARLILTLQWKRPAAAVPVRLVGWLDAVPVETSEATHASDNSSEQIGRANRESDPS